MLQKDFMKLYNVDAYNDYLLSVANEIEHELNVEQRSAYLNADIEKFVYNRANVENITFLNDIHTMNERSFNFYLAFSRAETIDEKAEILNDCFAYLRDVIIFYGAYVKNAELKRKIKNLGFKGVVSDITLFYERI